MNGYGTDGAGPSGFGGGGGAATGADAFTDITVPLGPTNQPKVSVSRSTPGQVDFELAGVELAFANSVRRVIMADVPTVSESAWSAL
jgi:DNA-directed RNA polymerase II subunit RPB3